MFKKIALAVALVAATSFATWDYYKVPEAGKGQGQAVRSRASSSTTPTIRGPAGASMQALATW